jgi:hypothetical protein
MYLAEVRSRAGVPAVNRLVAADARAYMIGLPKQRELRTHWQRACQLMLEQADIRELSRQLDLASIQGWQA